MRPRGMHPPAFSPRQASVLRRLGLAGVWASCTLVTTIAGVSAVQLVGHQVSDRENSALSPAAVQQAVAALSPSTQRAVPDPPAELFADPNPVGPGSGADDDGDVTPSAAATSPPTPSQQGGSGSSNVAHTAEPSGRATAPTRPTRPATSPRPSPPRPTPSSSSAVVQVPGGTVYLRCKNDVVSLTGGYPEDGYHVNAPHYRDHDRVVYIEFDHDGHPDSWQVWATCRGGEVRAVTNHDRDGNTPPTPTPTPTPTPSPKPSPTVVVPSAAAQP